MNKGMLTVGIILLSIIALLMINVLTNFSTGSELDYYLVKETTDAAMEDAFDDTFYRTCGLYRIDKEKFVESFIYRFANSIDATRDYKIRFYDINEVPPKVSVKVDSLTLLGVKGKGENEAQAADITTSYDAILETEYYNDAGVEAALHTPGYDNDQCKAFREWLNNGGKVTSEDND